MRPGQNKRMRGRSNNNSNGSRKGPNPLTRSYESNGPDVKIRGNAHHVAEKYLQLARDAQTSGDPVAAESYLQHAEHYFRLIASAQQAQSSPNRQPDGADLDGDEDDDNGIPDRFASPPAPTPFVPPHPQPQPYAGERQPYNSGERQSFNGDRQPNAASERPPYAERQSFNGERFQHPDRNGYGQRNDRQDRGVQDRNGAVRRPYRDNGDRGPEVRSGDERGGERFDRNRGQSRNGQERNGQDRNGQERGHDRTGQERAASERPPQERSYVQPPIEQPRDPFTGEQPRTEPAERQPRSESDDRRAEAITPVSAPTPLGPSPVVRPEPLLRSALSAPDDAPGLPSFITAPTRVVSGGPASDEPSEATASAFPGDDAAEATKFARRRRRPTRPAAATEGSDTTADGPASKE